MGKQIPTKQINLDVFKTQINAYKQKIDEDIAGYSKHVQMTTLQQYGAEARLETDAFLEILGRGGKRIRGALTIVGYEMSGGKFDIAAGVSRLEAEAASGTRMILQAARAIEMLHAYVLIIDDIQDHSLLRRGGPAAHKILADYHEIHHLAGDAGHFGVSIAMNAALAGAHAAQMILANLDAPEALRLSVISIVNRTMLITAHGQTSDIMNEVSDNVDMDAIDRVLAWKTAQYSFLNPLHVGMVLAGADCHATDAITQYATCVGKAYQITDDILGVFGSEQANGKSPMDDMREGKRTALTVYGLEHADKADKNFLIQMLGNEQLRPAEFERCKAILSECGALVYAQNAARQHIKQAIDSLDQEAERWTLESTQFLRGLAQYVLKRSS